MNRVGGARPANSDGTKDLRRVIFPADKRGLYAENDANYLFQMQLDGVAAFSVARFEFPYKQANQASAAEFVPNWDQRLVPENNLGGASLETSFKLQNQGVRKTRFRGTIDSSI